MKRTLLTFLFAVLCCFPAWAQTTDEEWQAKAIEEYPPLGVEGSDFHKRFLEDYTERQRTDPGFFTIPKWPLLLADHVATELAEEQAKANAPPPPAAHRHAAPPEADAQDFGTTMPHIPWGEVFSDVLDDYRVTPHNVNVAMADIGTAGAILVVLVAIIAALVRRRNKEQLERNVGRPSAPLAVPPGTVAEASKEEEALWIGHVSRWHYFGRWFFGALFFVVGIGALIILGALIDRARRVYIVTDRKVIFQSGLFAKSTNEIRIKDIRSITVTKNGIGGLMGIGSIEFSTAATDRAEIIFSGIADADRVRDLVNRLQDQG